MDSAYASRSDKVGYGGLRARASRAVMRRRKRVLLRVTGAWWWRRWERECREEERRMARGWLGGRWAKEEVMRSRKNW